MAMSLRSSLASRTASGPKTDAEVRAECRRAYHDTGVILLKPEWLPTWAERKQLEILAEKTFGRRQEAR